MNGQPDANRWDAAAWGGESAGPGPRGRRWVAHAGHAGCGSLAAASSSDGPHLARLRGFWDRFRDRDAE